MTLRANPLVVWRSRDEDRAGKRGAEGKRALRRLFAEEDHLSKCERIRVCDRELRGSTADLREAPRGAAMQPKLRRTTGLPNDFDIAPQHALRVAGAEGLHRRFLGRESTGEMNRRIAAPHAVGHLAFSEDAVGEPFAVSFDSRFDARDVRRVEAESDDGHASTA
jgi:hypothetical protein